MGPNTAVAAALVLANTLSSVSFNPSLLELWPRTEVENSEELKCWSYARLFSESRRA